MASGGNCDGERARAAWLAADQAEQAGDATRCGELAQRAVRLAPDDEPGARRLITLLERLGDRAGAGRACDDLERYLTTELEVAPSTETAALFARIRKNGDPTGSARGAPAPLRAMRSAAPEEDDFARNETTLEAPNAAASANELVPASELRPASRRRRVSRRTKFVALATAAVVVIVIAVTYQALHRPTAALPRVVVVPLDNRTGNAALDPVGLMTADWIERGLLKPGLLEVVPAASVQAVMSALTARNGAAAARGPTLKNIAKETGASLVVSGAYYTTDDRIRFELVLTDALHDRILVSFVPVTAALRDPTPALDTVRMASAGSGCTSGQRR